MLAKTDDPPMSIPRRFDDSAPLPPACLLKLGDRPDRPLACPLLA